MADELAAAGSRGRALVARRIGQDIAGGLAAAALTISCIAAVLG